MKEKTKEELKDALAIAIGWAILIVAFGGALAGMD